jgi:hypothetical protein
VEDNATPQDVAPSFRTSDTTLPGVNVELKVETRSSAFQDIQEGNYSVASPAGARTTPTP